MPYWQVRPELGIVATVKEYYSHPPRVTIKKEAKARASGKNSKTYNRCRAKMEAYPIMLTVSVGYYFALGMNSQHSM